MTQDALDQRVTRLRTDALSLLQDVSEDRKTSRGDHINLISALQEIANHLGTAQATLQSHQ